ncbi:MAG: DUF748 domain-containing protein [Bacteroidota bacterium]
MKKVFKIIIIVIAILVGIRLILPLVIKFTANRAIQKAEGYEGNLKEVDLNLIKGNYSINDLYLNQIMEDTKDTIDPFIEVDAVRISIEWDALFKGRIVGSVLLVNPEVNFVVIEEKPPKKVDIAQIIKDLVPFRINTLEIQDGNFAYYDFTTDPNIDAWLGSINLTANNLTNLENPTDTLPISMDAEGATVGDGYLNMSAEMNLLKQPYPNMDLNLALRNIRLTSLNKFAQNYGGFDFEGGTLSVFTEFAIQNGQLEGYLKPVFDHVEILEGEKEGSSGTAWEVILGGIKDLFSNPKEERLATTVPFSQNIQDVDVGIIEAIWELLENAFVEALNKNLDDSIEYPVEPKKEQ